MAEERILSQWQSKARCGEEVKEGGSRAGQDPRGKGRDQIRGWDQFTVAAKLDSTVSQIRPSGFFSFRTEEAFEDYYTLDDFDTSLLSSKPHTQLEEEDLADEGAKDEGRSG
jgi:hypothetical protein